MLNVTLTFGKSAYKRCSIKARVTRLLPASELLSLIAELTGLSRTFSCGRQFFIVELNAISRSRLSLFRYDYFFHIQFRIIFRLNDVMIKGTSIFSFIFRRMKSSDMDCRGRVTNSYGEMINE